VYYQWRITLTKVVDSWEDISAADAPALPKTAIKIEALPPKKEEVVAPKVKKATEKVSTTNQPEKPKPNLLSKE
jgi:hypothetical protein